MKKFNSQKGTTLVETLATIILIGLMGIAITSGIGAIQHAYRKVVRKANEQVLISTAVIQMRDMIRNSKSYVSGSDISPRFFSKEGYWFEFANDMEKGIQVTYYSDQDSVVGSTLPLIPKTQGRTTDSNTEFTKVLITTDGKVHITGLKAGDTTLIKETDEKSNDYYVTVIKKTNGGD